MSNVFLLLAVALRSALRTVAMEQITPSYLPGLQVPMSLVEGAEAEITQPVYSEVPGLCGCLAMGLAITMFYL